MKLAIKVENTGNRNLGTSFTKESYYLRMMNEKGCRLPIKYYGDGFVDGSQYLKLEYLEMTVEDYHQSPNIPGKLSLVDIAQQMVDCLEDMHKNGYIH